jgi:hypothetical protein
MTAPARLWLAALLLVGCGSSDSTGPTAVVPTTQVARPAPTTPPAVAAPRVAPATDHRHPGRLDGSQRPYVVPPEQIIDGAVARVVVDDVRYGRPAPPSGGNTFTPEESRQDLADRKKARTIGP